MLIVNDTWPSNLETPVVLQVINQFTTRHSVDTIWLVCQKKILLICIWYAARPMAMREALLGCIRGVFPTDIRLGISCLPNLHRRLRELECFKENRRGFGWPMELCDAVDEDVLQFFRKSRICSRQTTSTREQCLWQEQEYYYLFKVRFLNRRRPHSSGRSTHITSTTGNRIILMHCIGSTTNIGQC